MKHKIHTIKKLSALAALLVLLLCPGMGWGQTTIAAWTYPTTTGNAPNTLAAECGTLQASSNFYADGSNSSDNWSDASSRQYFAGVNPASSLCSVSTATGAYSLVNSPNSYNGKSVVFKVSTIGYQQLNLSYDTRGTATGFSTHVWSYSTDGTTFNTQSTITGRNATTFSTQSVNFSAISSLNNQTGVYIKLTLSGASGTGNNRLDNINFSATITGVSPPTTQASAITFSSIGETGMTANWTNGDGAKRIVIMNTSNSFTAPADGSDPTVNTVYSGSGEQVVYNGSGNSVGVAGLSASTTYWFRVYEYNGNGATTKYLTTTATNNPNSQATTAPPPQIDWCNLQWPPTGSINLGDAFSVYAQVYEPGITNNAGQGAGILSWIGYSTVNDDPATGSNWVWVPALYNGEAGNNDEYMANIGAAITSQGTYYYASRFQLGAAPFVYGGTGGLWTSGTSGTLTVNPANQIDWANLQSPATGTITAGGTFNVYAQVFEPGVTDAGGQGAAITAWIGYNSTNNDPAIGSGWTWVTATYNTDAGNNDEYKANIAPGLIQGTYYYASRFKMGLADYVYGGLNGFWNVSSSITGVLTVNTPPMPNAWINEIHYDNSSADVGEFIEIVVENAGSFTLSGIRVDLYNGNGGAVYDTKTLDQFTVGNTVGNFTFYTNNIYTSGIQNGAPDGMALSYFGTLVPGQFLSYEGTMTGTAGVANGVTSIDIGVSEAGNVAAGSSLQLAGASTAYSGFAWQPEALNTSGAINHNQYFYITTTWDGSESNAWNVAGNWDNGVPVAALNAIIPDVANDPVISTTATCKNLTINAGVLLTVNSGASLITTGTVTGSASVKRDIGANEWHLISSPVSGAQAGIFTGQYLQSHNEQNNAYTDITSTTDPLNVMQGYALWPDANPFTAEFSGTLNSGNQSFSAAKSGAGWNLTGNPYPSSINWDLVSVPSGLNNAIYKHANASTWATYAGGVGNPTNNEKYIAPCQGFFVEATAPATLLLDNSVRVHSSATFYKNSEEVVHNLIRVEISGNSYTDQAVVRFLPEATAEFDGAYDAHKLYGDVPEAAQIYTMGNSELSINTLPETNIVFVGIHGISGTYTLAATEINDLNFVTLEDTKTGIFTELAKNPYTFNLATGENEQRFKLHFSTLGIGETGNTTANIYSHQQTVFINLNEKVKGDIFIYNIAGQLITSKPSAAGMNEIKLSNTGNYIVKVISKESSVVKKVYIQ